LFVWLYVLSASLSFVVGVWVLDVVVVGVVGRVVGRDQGCDGHGRDLQVQIQAPREQILQVPLVQA